MELPESTFLGADDSRMRFLGKCGGSRTERSKFLLDHDMAHSELGHIADGRFDKYVSILKYRFEICPVNMLCYYQSYHSSEDAMLQLRSLMDHDPLAAVTQVDRFGMTPLHVLSLSQTSNVDMLIAVMKAGPRDHVIRSRDKKISTPMDNPCLNRICRILPV
eukprot:scaffold11647_cov55-Cylindrotheca_fusiformis.AAC.3